MLLLCGWIGRGLWRTCTASSLGTPASRLLQKRAGSPRSQAPASNIAVDVACRSPYNAPARLGYWLTLSLVAEYEPAYTAHVSLAILSTFSAVVPPLSGPFREEAATPQSRLISSPAGGASPSSALIPYSQRSCTLSAAGKRCHSDCKHTSVGRAMRLCTADGSRLGVETQSPPRVFSREVTHGDTVSNSTTCAAFEPS